jgi:hypothetical protein
MTSPIDPDLAGPAQETTGTDYRPSPKVQAGATAGAVALVLVWLAGLLGLELPAEVAAALAVILSTAAAYIKTA